MKKSLKTLLITGFLTGMCTLTPVYGAEYVQNGAIRVIRVGQDAPSAASVYDQQANISPGSTTGPDGVSVGGNVSNPGSPSAGQTGGPTSGNVIEAEPNYIAEQQALDAQAAAEQAAAEQAAAEQAAAEQAAAQQAAAEQAAAQQAAAQQAAAEQAAAEQAAAEQAAAEQAAAEQAAAEQAAAQSASGRHIDPSKPMVALTFDDGPYAKVGNRIMDVMNQYGGKCTFFMVGNRVATYKTEVNRMVQEGFEVANHTQDHKMLNKLGAAAIQSQVSKCNDSIQAVCGVRPTLMRLPGGNKNSTVVANTGMPMIQWNIDTLDWKTKNTQSTINAVVGKVKDGDIVLMHELYPATAAAVEQIVPALVNKGFQLVTVSELAQYKGKSLSAGHTYSEIR